MLIAVPAPPKLIVVAVVLIKLNVVDTLANKSPPRISKSPRINSLPPIYEFPLTPNPPPLTTNAPVAVEVAALEPATVNELVKVELPPTYNPPPIPTPPTTCNAPVFVLVATTALVTFTVVNATTGVATFTSGLARGHSIILTVVNSAAVSGTGRFFGAKITTLSDHFFYSDYITLSEIDSLFNGSYLTQGVFIGTSTVIIPKSLTITPILRPWFSLRIWLSNVVLPAPKNPTIAMIGTYFLRSDMLPLYL